MTEHELNAILMDAFPELKEELTLYMEEDGDGMDTGCLPAASLLMRMSSTPLSTKRSRTRTSRFSSGLEPTSMTNMQKMSPSLDLSNGSPSNEQMQQRAFPLAQKHECCLPSTTFTSMQPACPCLK